jgi:hypothetical protein
MTEPSISVITCAHNPKERYFAQTLGALRAQSMPTGAWDYLIVDNASDPPLEGRIDLAWHPRARIVREEKLGLTPARLRGIAETQGELVVLVDDDNVLDPDFLEVAARTARERPYLGAWSGQCRGGFEAPPPDWAHRYFGNLAIRQFDHDVWSNLPRLPATMPCGAGLCVRREVAQHYLDLHAAGARQFQFDRTGDSLISGGDNDLAACACATGLGVGLVSALGLTHLIPPERLTAAYLTRLAEGIHFSATLLDAEWGLTARPRSWIGRLADKMRALRLAEPHRRIARAAHRGRDRATQLLAARQGS